MAYFSRSGNTRVAAGLIRRARGTDLFEVRPASAAVLVDTELALPHGARHRSQADGALTIL